MMAHHALKFPVVLKDSSILRISVTELGVIPLLSYIDSFIEITENNYFYMKNINLFSKQFWKIIMNKNLLSSYCLVLNNIYEDNKIKYLDGVNNLKKVINEL